MTDRTNSPKPKQKTPKGYEIPVPKRRDFDKVLKKAATPARSRPKDSKS